MYPTQTTAPSVEKISTTAADGIPRGLARRSQTIDIYNGSTAIESGGFRLKYGEDAKIVTSCIPGNTTQLTADIVSSAFTSANSFLNVTVEEDDAPYDGARRFVVYFNEPELAVGSLALANIDGDECEWFQCSDEECSEAGVVINRDVSASVQEGVVEVGVCSKCYSDVRTPF